MPQDRPVLSKNTFYESLSAYEPAELLYREYYHISQENPEKALAFLDSLSKEEQSWFFTVLPPEKYPHPLKLSPMARKMRKLSAFDIIGLKHLRYSPVFVHEHQVYEIFYVYKGHCTNVIQDHVMECREGDVCFIPPRVSHSIAVFDDSLIINLNIAPEAFQNIFSGIFPGKNPLTQFYLYALTEKGDKNYLLFQTGQDALIRSILEDIYLETYIPGKYANSMQRTLFSYFLITLIRRHESDLNYFLDTKNRSLGLADLMSYFQRNYTDITLRGAASHFGFSEAYFSRLVKKSTGQNFSTIIHQIRLDNAARALRQTRLPVQKICEQAGFENPAHFSRAFKEAYGVTPKEYRASCESHNIL